MAAPTALLRALGRRRSTADNAQREYYLTDIVALAVADGVPVDGARRRRRARRARRQRPRAARRARAHRPARAGATRCWTPARALADPGAHRRPRHARLRPRRAHRRRLRVRRRRARWPTTSSVGAYCVLKRRRPSAPAPRSRRSRTSRTPTIGANCRIGPYARLRPGAALADDVHIGNFVEVKASTLGRGAQGQPPRLHRRRDRRRRRQRRRRHDHRQLRRREQAPHGDRGRRVHRLRTACWSRRSPSARGATIGARQHDRAGRAGRTR